MRTKSEIMKILGMTSGVDTAIPVQIINQLSKKGISHDAVVSNFVMDHRTNTFGQLTPITLTGAEMLNNINKRMEWDIPSPASVVEVDTGVVWSCV